jgi:hypothetical protein
VRALDTAAAFRVAWSPGGAEPLARAGAPAALPSLSASLKIPGVGAWIAPGGAPGIWGLPGGKAPACAAPRGIGGGTACGVAGCAAVWRSGAFAFAGPLVEAQLALALLAELLHVVGELRHLLLDLLDRGAFLAAPGIARVERPAGRRQGHGLRRGQAWRGAFRFALLVQDRAQEAYDEDTGEEPAREQDLAVADRAVDRGREDLHSVGPRSRTTKTLVASPGARLSCSIATASTPAL